MAKLWRKSRFLVVGYIFGINIITTNCGYAFDTLSTNILERKNPARIHKWSFEVKPLATQIKSYSWNQERSPLQNEPVFGIRFTVKYKSREF